MALINKNREPTPGELRIFGVLMAVFFSSGRARVAPHWLVALYHCALDCYVASLCFLLCRTQCTIDDLSHMADCGLPDWLAHLSCTTSHDFLPRNDANRIGSKVVWS